MKKLTVSLSLVLTLISVVISQDGIEIKQLSPTQMAVYIKGSHFTTWNYGEELNGVYLNKPVLWPVLTTKGSPITRDFPFETNRIEERQDHPHHQGIFFTYGLLNYGEEDSINVWGISKAGGNEPPGYGKSAGKIINRNNKVIKSGSSSAMLQSTSEWFSHSANKIFLMEDRTMTFGYGPNFRYIDFIFRFNTLDQPVTWVDTKEGMFAIRVTPSLNENQKANDTATQIEPGKAKYVNASGGEYERGVWGKRSPWVALKGILDSAEPLTIVIMDHPDNLNHPTFWHARAYGLFSLNPFGVYDFTRREQNFNFKLPAGGHLTLKYRMLFYEGYLEMTELRARFDDYITQ
jgi:hypothetical protein